jgi:hypothetical protein
MILLIVIPLVLSYTTFQCERYCEKYYCKTHYPPQVCPKVYQEKRMGNCCSVDSDITAYSCSICCHPSEEAHCINKGSYNIKCICK